MTAPLPAASPPPPTPTPSPSGGLWSKFRRNFDHNPPLGKEAQGSAEGTQPVRVQLIGRPGCHLCDDARAVVERVCGDLGVAWTESNIDEDEVLASLYWERIPVVVADGTPVDFWRVDEARLRQVLA